MGEIGEIILRTPYVGLGYLDRPDLQQVTYSTNRYRHEGNDVLYHTGDLGRFRPDGLIEILDRMDRQVKILGARVEPLEIELALATLPEVAEVAVTAQKNVSGENILVAHIVAAADCQPTAATLSTRLREILPAFMIPSQYVFLSRMPRSASGKIDRGALPPAASQRDEAATAYVAPRNPLELQLARIWEDLLAVDRVSMTDNFFDLGGHSLLAIRMIARVEQALGRTLPPAVLFPHATVEHLARFLHDSSPQPWDPLVPIQPARDGRPKLFCMHPAGGSVLCYVDLARLLGGDQPVYGLQGPDPRGSLDPLEDATEMAVQYLAAMRRVQPHGPYHLAGFSFGGIIAFAVAHLLLREKETVGLLALLDTGYPRSCGMRNDRGLIHDLAGLLERHDLSEFGEVPQVEAAEHRLWRDLLELTGKYLPSQSHSSRDRKSRGMAAVQEFFRTYRFLPTGEEMGYADIRRYLRFLRANIRASHNYRPAPIASRLVLFRAENELPDTVADSNRKEQWAELTLGGLDIVNIPGNHLNLLGSPAVEVLAEKLRERLDRSVESIEFIDSGRSHATA
jgi:thioesterase domain-containing protein/acyl carrier protein